MRAADRERMGVNQQKWDESVPLHVASSSYDVPSFRRGRTTLRPLEIAEMGPVRGRSLLHLQCHFGLDTLSWARRGAVVTGVDFSPTAVATARLLAEECRIPATFVESNLYDLPAHLRGRFDRVYTAKGVLCWLPDLSAWGRLVARYLRPGGRFYLLEDHPFSDIFDNDSGVRRLVQIDPYFRREARRGVYDGTYATKVRMKHRVSFDWIHPVSEILSALLDAGLRLEFVHEFPYTYWKKFPFMRRDREGWWHLTRGDGMIPLMWSVRATLPK
jgi:SAM-dependent methyltransferase